MAYLLRTSLANNRVTLPTDITLFANVGDYIEVQFELNTATTGAVLMLGDFGQLQILLTDTFTQLKVGSTRVDSTFSSILSQIVTLKFERTSSTQITTSIPEISLSAAQDISGSADVDVFFARNNGNNNVDVDCYYIEIGNSSGAVHFFDPTDSGGTGSVLDNTLGGIDGALAGFPADDSEWVFYSASAGVTLDGAFSLPTLSVNGSITASLPQPNIDGAFSFPNLNVSGTASATVPASDYQLHFNTAGQKVSFTALSSSTNWNFTVNAANKFGDEMIVFGTPDLSSFDNFIILRNANTFDYRVGGVLHSFAVTDVTDIDAVYRLQMRAGTLSFIENGSFVSSTTAASTIPAVSRISATNGTDRRGIFGYAELDDIDTPANNIRLDSSASNGTGLILPDDIGTNDGTLNEFDPPNDDSQWVVYTPPVVGVSITGAFSLPNLTMLGAITASLPQPNVAGAFSLPALNIQGSVTVDLPQPNIAGAFALPVLSVNGAVTVALPQPSIAGAFNLPALSVSGSVSASLPQPSIAGAFSISALSVAGTASATTTNPEVTGAFTLASITVNGSGSATLPQPIINAAFNLPGLTVAGTGSALVPQPIINGNIALPSLLVSGSVTVSLPQPIANGAFSLPMLNVTGFATVSGIDIIVDSKTNINQQFLSNNIDQIFLSNNITYN